MYEDASSSSETQESAKEFPVLQQDDFPNHADIAFVKNSRAKRYELTESSISSSDEDEEGDGNGNLQRVTDQVNAFNAHDDHSLNLQLPEIDDGAAIHFDAVVAQNGNVSANSQEPQTHYLAKNEMQQDSPATAKRAKAYCWTWLFCGCKRKRVGATT